jgi:hypothetical protein
MTAGDLHDHHHDHHREQSAEPPYLDPGPGRGDTAPVVVDIGGDVGALVVYADEAFVSREVDITPVGGERSHLVHTMLRRRRLPNSTGQEAAVGVYPELVAGRYWLWGDCGPVAEVEVRGGEVAEIQLGLLAAATGLVSPAES